MLLLGPLVWGFIRHTRGLPAFDNNAAAWRLPEPRPADLPRPVEHPRMVETPQSRNDAT
jgi:hypothetical protein